MKSIACLSGVGALVYSLGFWGVDLSACVTSLPHCSFQGDGRAVLLVASVVVLIMMVLLIGYFSLLRRFIDMGTFKRRGLVRAFIFGSSFVYSLVVGLGMLEILGNRGDFWMNALAASSLLSIGASLFALRPDSRSGAAA